MTWRSSGPGRSDVAGVAEAAGWRTVFDELWRLPSDSPITDDLALLQEDLFQAQHPDGRVLDIGWYPAEARSGTFVVCVIQGGDWDNPLARASAGTDWELRHVVGALVEDA